MTAPFGRCLLRYGIVTVALASATAASAQNAAGPSPLSSSDPASQGNFHGTPPDAAFAALTPSQIACLSLASAGYTACVIGCAGSVWCYRECERNFNAAVDAC